MDQGTDELLRVYARLTALRTNFANAEYVPDEAGQEYDALLDRAERALSRDFDEFKIGDSHHASISDSFYEGNAFRSRVDGAINYLTFLMPQEAKTQIGFSAGST